VSLQLQRRSLDKLAPYQKLLYCILGMKLAPLFFLVFT